MPRKSSSGQYSEYGDGTYEVPGVGLILNGVLLDGTDPEQVAAYHVESARGEEAAIQAIQERDAVIVEAVNAPADAPADGE